MEKIPIDIKRNIIIVEKSEGDDVPAGTKFFCGCCGNLLCESNKRLTFPFNFLDFKRAIIKRTFETSFLGVTHETCGNIIFPLKMELHFVRLQDYKEGVQQILN